jgi:hypothetical protein
MAAVPSDPSLDSTPHYTQIKKKLCSIGFVFSVNSLDDQGSEFESRWGQEFSHVVQTGSGVHPTSYPMGTGGFFLGVKRPGSDADHSPPTSAEVKKTWIYTSTNPYVFMA